MTLHYHRGMSLGEFQDMIAEHQRDEARRRGQPPAVEVGCEHPFEAEGMSVTAHKVEGGVEVRARYQCPPCGAKWGVRRLLASRRAKVEASG